MSKVSPHLHQRVVEKVEWCRQLANKTYGMNLPMPDIKYDLRGQTAGRAHDGYRMSLHPGFLVTETEDMINDTAPHEYAHLVVRARQHLGHYGSSFPRGKRIRPHGDEWIEVMQLFGVPARRCHDYDVSIIRVRKTRYQYKCSKPGCGQVITVGGKIHNQIKNSPDTRWHRGCRGYRLIHVGIQGPTKGGHPITSNSKLKLPDADSKLGQCYALFKSWNHRYGRQDMIALFTNEVFPLTTACASTYYYQCQKLWEAGL